MATTDLVDRDSELKPYLGVDPDDHQKDPLLNLLNDSARGLVEGYIGRLLVTRGAITEFHSIWNRTAEIYTTQWPIISVTSVHEDDNTTYDANSILTVTTDYVVSNPSGKILRVSNGVHTTWLIGYRTVQVIYTAGYAATANIPSDIKYEVMRMIGAMWSEVGRGEYNMSSVSDDMGNVSRFVPPGLNADVRRVLDRYRAPTQSPTGEVDA